MCALESVWALLAVQWTVVTASPPAASFIAYTDPLLQCTGRVAFNKSIALWEWPGVRVAVGLSCIAGILTGLSLSGSR